MGEKKNTKRQNKENRQRRHEKCKQCQTEEIIGLNGSIMLLEMLSIEENVWLLSVITAAF